MYSRFRFPYYLSFLYILLTTLGCSDAVERSSSNNDIPSAITIEGSTPTANAQNISLDINNIKIITSVPLDPLTLDENTVLFIDSDGLNIPYTLSYDTNTRTLDLNIQKKLSYKTKYQIILKADIKTESGTQINIELMREFTTVQRPSWVKHFIDTTITSILPTSDSGILVAGNKTNTNAWLIKFNADGDQIWSKTYGENQIIEIQKISNDSILVLARATFVTPESPHFTVIKLSQNGNIVWQKGYNGTQPLNLSNMKVANDESIYIGGYISTQATYEDLLIIKLNNNGETLWQKHYGTSFPEYDFTIDVLPTDGVIAAGKAYSTATGAYDPWMLRINGGGDALVWNNLYQKDGNGGLFDAILVLSNGDVIAGGPAPSATTSMMVIKSDSDGNTLWQKTYFNDKGINVNAINEMKNGELLIAANAYFLNPENRFPVMMRLSQSGDILWQRTFQGMGGGSSNQIIQLNDGSFVASGNFNPSSVLGIPITQKSDGAWLMVQSYEDSSVLNPYSGAKYQKSNFQATDASFTFEQPLTNIIDFPLTTQNPTISVGSENLLIENVSGQSNVLVAASGISAVASASRDITITWNDNTTEELGYIIFRSSDALNFLRYDTVAADVKIYIDDRVIADADYYYKIVAFNQFGYSDYSEVSPKATALP